MGKLARVLVAEDRTSCSAPRTPSAPPRPLRRGASAWACHGALRALRARPRLRGVRRREGRGIEQESDVVLVDTAGRLRNKAGLMDQLGKVKRVIEKAAAVDEVLLVIDATTGQNGMTRRRVFAEAVDIAGIVLAKLDGTAKGGIVGWPSARARRARQLIGLGRAGRPRAVQRRSRLRGRDHRLTSPVPAPRRRPLPSRGQAVTYAEPLWRGAAHARHVRCGTPVNVCVARAARRTRSLRPGEPARR
ncbi:hypothetical protein QJS66_01020 [Kocuria rhizophila]|nr:hypothetical protein QJS66_01020 [Kocuria rhizophila]